MCVSLTMGVQCVLTMCAFKDPNSFITSATESRYQRAVSLPAPEVSRTSALGSHAPFALHEMERPVENKDLEGKVAFERRTRPRRATLPSVVITPIMRDEMLGGLSPGQEEVSTHSMGDDNIGFAITSGSNPKRRSKSVEGLFDSARSHQLSPIPGMTVRRRSEEIQYWRNSVISSPSPIISDELQQPLDQIEEHPAIDAKSLHREEPGDKDARQTDRNTFDFGLLASTMQDQEQVGLEERVVTVEVKLMDLEYAISKLQARTSSPADISSRPRPNSSDAMHQPDPPVRPFRGLRSESSKESVSEVAEPEQSGCGHHRIRYSHSFSTGSPKERKSRPISTATTVRPYGNLQGPPSPSETTVSRNVNRASLTAITTDHYATLVSLLRREQTARSRLQEQVNELQLQVQELLASSTPQLANQSWLHHSYQPNKPSLQSGYHGHGTEYDETDTDDGYGEVYETPTEQTEFSPRAPYMNLIEGEAF